MKVAPPPLATIGAGIVALIYLGTAAADLHADEIGCTAEQDFYCDAAGCTSSNEPDTIEAGLSLDMATGAGSLCEYSQCRDFTAMRLDGAAFWEAQLSFGPSTMVLYQLEQGVDVQTESLLPTNGMLSIDEATNRFLMTEQSGTTVSGYLGSCELAPVP